MTDPELRELHRGAREERKRMADDPGPCEPPRAEDRHTPTVPLRSEDGGRRVYHTVCGSLVDPDPSDMTFVCTECETRIDPAEYHTEGDA